MQVYVIVQAMISGVYRFVDVKKTKGQAIELISELIAINASVGVVEVSYKLIEKNI